MENKIKEVLKLKVLGEFTQAYKEIRFLENESLKIERKSYLKGRIAFTKGRVEIDLGNYDQAILSSDDAIKFYKSKLDIASAFNLKGVAFFFKSELDSTLYYYNTSFKLKKENKADPEELAISSYNIAIVNEDSGKLDDAIQGYKAAAKYVSKLENNVLLPNTFLGIANTYALKRDDEKAQLYGEKALNGALAVYGDESPDITFFYLSYASILKRNNEFKKARNLLQKVKEIRVNTYGKYHEWSCEAFYKLGEIDLLRKDYESSETFLLEAIRIGGKINSKVYTSYAKKQLASLYLETNASTENAVLLTKSALKTLKSIYGEHHELITECYLLLAKLEVENKKGHIALSYKSANYDRNRLTGVIAPFQVLQAMEYETELYYNDFLKTDEVHFLEQQFELINPKLALIKMISKGYSSDASKIALANLVRNSIESSITVCWNLFERTKNETFKNKAFQLSEFHRNSILLFAVIDTKQKEEIIPSSYLSQEKNLREQITKVDLEIHYEQLELKPSIENLNRLHTKRGFVGEKLDSLKRKLDTLFPKYNRQARQQKHLSFSQVQKSLQHNQQILSYFVGEQNAFVFSVDKSAYHFERIKSYDQLITNANTVKNSIINRTESQKYVKKLFSILTKNGELLVKKNLLFITDDVLNYVPFEILTNDKNEYLIANHNVSYLGSFGLFLEQNRIKKELKLEEDWIGFSPEYEVELSLQNAKKEVELITEITKGRNFMGSESTKSNFLENANKAKILHLAMHTNINNRKPQFNQLLFYDEALTASEIYTATIKAELLVLSACETGYGKLEKGEGVMNLSRAFTYAGVPSTVMSLWRVPDQETSQIMISFYKHLKNGKQKNEALRAAKLEYLSSTDDTTLKHPYYWAGFIISGDISPIMSPVTISTYVIGGGLLCILFGLYFFKKNVNIHKRRDTKGRSIT